MYNLYGKLYKITAMFVNVDKCNKYLLENKDQGVLAVDGRLIFVASMNDMGV